MCKHKQINITSAEMDRLIELIAAGDTNQVDEYIKTLPKGFVRRNNTPRVPLLNHAIETNDVSMVKCLIAGDVPVNDSTIYGLSPLVNASRKGLVEIVRVLLEAGADPEYPEYYRNSVDPPFTSAIYLGHLDVVDVFLAHGVNLNYRTQMGITALLRVIEPDDDDEEGDATGPRALDKVQLLVENGASVHIGTEHGYMPIHKTATIGSVEIAKYLLQKGASVKVADGSTGSTPLHVAITQRHFSYVQFLVRETDAHVNAITIHGETPLDCLLYDAPATDDDDDMIVLLWIAGARLRWSHRGNVIRAKYVYSLLAKWCLSIRRDLTQQHNIPMDVARRITRYLF
jgi:ankyrin repeat protein